MNRSAFGTSKRKSLEGGAYATWGLEPGRHLAESADWTLGMMPSFLDGRMLALQPLENRGRLRIVIQHDLAHRSCVQVRRFGLIEERF